MGKATALSYAEAGVRALVCADINDVSATQTAEEAKSIASNDQFDVLVVKTDMTNEDSVKELIKKSVEKFGRIDYCANVAGVSIDLPFIHCY